jgi:uncharacterized protein
MSVLVIDLEELRSGSHRSSGEIDPSELKLADPSELRFDGLLELDIRISTTDILSFHVHGGVSYRVNSECRRCLRPVSAGRNTELRGMYSFAEGLERLELSEEELELQGIFPLAADSDCLDLTDLVREAVVLDYPRFLLCSEDCRGLCPGCGADLNEEACRCASNAVDPRWSKLIDLKKEKNN